MNDIPAQSPPAASPAACRQTHVKLPAVLLQTDPERQPPLFTAHSSISTTSIRT